MIEIPIQRQDEPRVEYMLKVAAAYIRKHCPDEKIFYDDAECDGYCVAAECEELL